MRLVQQDRRIKCSRHAVRCTAGVDWPGAAPVVPASVSVSQGRSAQRRPHSCQPGSYHAASANAANTSPLGLEVLTKRFAGLEHSTGQNPALPRVTMCTRSAADTGALQDLRLAQPTGCQPGWPAGSHPACSNRYQDRTSQDQPVCCAGWHGLQHYHRALRAQWGTGATVVWGLKGLGGLSARWALEHPSLQGQRLQDNPRPARCSSRSSLL